MINIPFEFRLEVFNSSPWDTSVLQLCVPPWWLLVTAPQFQIPYSGIIKYTLKKEKEYKKCIITDRKKKKSSVLLSEPILIIYFCWLLLLPFSVCITYLKQVGGWRGRRWYLSTFHHLCFISSRRMIIECRRLRYSVSAIILPALPRWRCAPRSSSWWWELGLRKPHKSESPAPPSLKCSGWQCM